ncbi:MAG TPA: type II CAAX endopeptidase family protein [Miltoncostaeaceae bacterium]|nr:type II CAAX endopeptidase family protein [Miltoncostaeaceae bacterium]
MVLSFALAMPVAAVMVAAGASDGAVGAVVTAAGGGLMLLFAWLFWRGLPAHERRLAIAVKGRRWPAVAWGALVGFGLMVGSVAVVAAGAMLDPTVADRLEERSIDIGSAPWQRGLMLIGLVVLAPLSEELVFRGLLLRTLARRFAFWPAAAISGLVFGGVHIDAYEVWPRLLALALSGVGLAVLYRWRGYPAAVAAHATVNAVAAVALLAG